MLSFITKNFLPYNCLILRSNFVSTDTSLPFSQRWRSLLRCFHMSKAASNREDMIRWKTFCLCFYFCCCFLFAGVRFAFERAVAVRFSLFRLDSWKCWWMRHCFENLPRRRLSHPMDSCSRTEQETVFHVFFHVHYSVRVGPFNVCGSLGG